VEGTLRQEKTIHEALTQHFGRIHIPCPPNEWYPGKLPFMQNFIAELRISVSGAIAFADKCSIGNKHWFGGIVGNPPRPPNDVPVLCWPKTKTEKKREKRAREREKRARETQQ
jgi:hypothetical protein